jgi:hypothetical protein
MNELSARVRLASEAQPLPKMWIGILLGIMFLVMELIDAILFQNGEIHSPLIDFKSPPALTTAYWLIGLIIWIYWLYCVFKINEAVDRVPGYHHPITPARAVAFHFLPLFNIYWIFKWPTALAKFVNWRMQARRMHGWIAGLLVLISVIIFRILDGFFGAMLLYGSGWYINHWLRKAFTAPPVPESAMKPLSHSQILDL